ncbi:uncharacterized protein PAE49_021037 [Odontesthes bonariensis]|uniref:uncharacterized protein LOC142368618 n=1 Tax=Odontesthes bonariensis TaxID=219752 RepID=UPI003F58F964
MLLCTFQDLLCQPGDGRCICHVGPEFPPAISKKQRRPGDSLRGNSEGCRVSRVGHSAGIGQFQTIAAHQAISSPFLFTLYTTDFKYNSESCHLQKYSDASAVVGCIRDGQEGEYRALVEDFVDCSGRNHLLLNVAKTREMVVDFRRRRTAPKPLCVLGEDVAVVDYKYLGVHLDNGLNWRTNTDAVKKGMSRLYFLRKLRSFNVCSELLEMFIRAGDTSRLNKLIKKAGSVIGCKLDSFESVVERRTLNKLLSIMDNPTHPLQQLLVGQQSSFSNRLIQLHCHKDRFRKSFLPAAITIYNTSPLAGRELQAQ